MNEIELWAARELDGKLYLYRYKPIKDKFVWYSPGFSLALGRTPFPEVQWSDKEPTRVSIFLKYTRHLLNLNGKEYRNE